MTGQLLEVQGGAITDLREGKERRGGVRLDLRVGIWEGGLGVKEGEGLGSKERGGGCSTRLVVVVRQGAVEEGRNPDPQRLLRQKE